MQAQQQLHKRKKELPPRPYTQPTLQVCVGDIVEISVNIFSMQGLTDPSSVKWRAPALIKCPRSDFLHYNKEMKERRYDQV